MNEKTVDFSDNECIHPRRRLNPSCSAAFVQYVVFVPNLQSRIKGFENMEIDETKPKKVCPRIAIFI